MAYNLPGTCYVTFPMPSIKCEWHISTVHLPEERGIHPAVDVNWRVFKEGLTTLHLGE